MWRSLACLLLATSIAHADDLPTIESTYVPYLELSPGGRVGLDEVRLDLRSGISWLHLELVNTARWGDQPVELVAPRGTRILGMAFAQDATTKWSALQSWRAARSTFADDRSDTAMLTLEGESTSIERFALFVHGKATVDIALELPQLDRLAVGATVKVGHLAVDVDGVRRVDRKNGRDGGTVALAGIIAEPTDAPHVDADNSLLVDGRAVELPAPPEGFDDQPRVRGSIDKAMIRRVFDRHRPQLRRCYTAAVEHAHPTLEGEVTLHFTIAGGKIEEVSIDSALPDEVTRCLATQLGGWEFPVTEDEHVQVNYPIKFTLARARRS